MCAVFAAGRKRSLADFATTMGRREAPYEHFCEAKISAQAEFISAEHFQTRGYPRKRSFRGSGRTVGSGVVIDIEE